MTYYYYVAMNGDDSNPGTTEDKPLRTIQKAADIVEAGDRVLVKQGTYPGFWIKDKHGRPEAWIVFKPYPGHEKKVIIDSHLNSSSLLRAIEMSGCSYIELNGFEITDSNSAYDNPSNREGIDRNGIKLNPAHDSYPNPDHIRIVNNHIYHTGDMGILGGGHNIEFINNHIHHVGLSKSGYGIYFSGSDLLFRGNIIHHAYGYGMHLYPFVVRSIIEQNVLYDNGSPDFHWYDQVRREGDGIIVGYMGHGWDNIVRNNIVYNNINWGIRVGDKSTLVVNNTVYGNGLQGIHVFDDRNALIRNNIAYGNRGEGAYPGDYYIGPGNTQDHNLFSTDPNFVDAANGDFHLQAGSLAIDAGIPIPGFNTDFEGTRRPQGAGWDIGAYEFGDTRSLIAELNVSPTSGQAPLLVNFNGSASGGKAPYTYSWNFGDGNSSTLQNPVHMYQQANSYIAKLTVTDSENKQATASRTIVVEAVTMNEPVVTNMRFSEVNQTADLPAMTTNQWYDLYLYVDDPQGWNDISYADVWLSHESNNEGTIANRGGRYFAASNYILSYSIANSGIWSKQTEGTETWTDITDQLGLYVDDDNNEYEQRSSEKWAKARIKLLQNAQTGNWVMNAYVIDKAGHRSSLFQRNFFVSSTVISVPIATVTLSDPSPTKAGPVQVSLTTSKPVVKIPTPLIFIESDSSTTKIDLSGSIPGNVFNGLFVVDDTVADGFGHFSLTAEALVDKNGIKSNEIKSGASVKIDKSPPSTPKNVKVDIIPP